MNNQNKDQNVPPNDYQKNSQNLDNTGNKNLFVGDKSDSDIELNRRFILDHKDKDAELISNLEKLNEY